MKRFLFLSSFLVGAFFVFSSKTPAQVTVTLGGVSVAAPPKGETQNVNVSSGSRTSLVVGNSTSFGASAQLNTSPGVTALSSSTLTPTSISIGSNIGQNALQSTTISIANLSSKDNAKTSDADGLNTSDIGNSSASGNVSIDGMSAEVKLDIRTPATLYEGVAHEGPGEASFDVAVFPVRDGAPSEECVDNARACTFTSTDNLKSGNASASANLNTSTNVDINANEFTNIFAQSF